MGPPVLISTPGPAWLFQFTILRRLTRLGSAGLSEEPVFFCPDTERTLLPKILKVVQEILKHRDPSNLVMITHDLDIANVVLEDTVLMGEFFVVQPISMSSVKSG